MTDKAKAVDVLEDAAGEVKPLPKVEISIASDGLDAEITVDGQRIEGVRRYRVEHERDALCLVTLEIYSECTITGPGTVTTKALES